MAPGRMRAYLKMRRSSGGNVPGAAVSNTKVSRLAASSFSSHSSAMPGNWNSSMYQLFCCCSGTWRHSALATGCGELRMKSERTISGRSAEVAQHRLPPQSCPARWADSSPRPCMSPTTSPTRSGKA